LKKDIQIPKVENLHLAIVQEYNDAFKSNDSYAYLINKKEADLEMVLIVSKGFDHQVVTAQMRHKIDKLPAKSVAKIELIQEEVLQLKNVFKVTFFENNKMFEKDFTIDKKMIKESNFRFIKSLNKRGIIIK